MTPDPTDCFRGLRRLFLVGLGVCAGFVSISFGASPPLADYEGRPYGDAKHPAAAQAIPGSVWCAYYDVGGEGVAYHDSDAVNNGSGKLNPANGTYLNEFRMHEGVDTSYTKFHDAIDRNPFNKIQPEEGWLYVGWTEPGEWFNVLVKTETAGVYIADLLYTAAVDGEIAIDVNFAPAGRPVRIMHTSDPAEPIKWRNWHHWNLARNAVTLRLPEGVSVLTIHIVKGGNMNLCKLDFRRVD